jgi:hypothetical protein
MDKNKTLNDFLVLNQSLITNMESQSPEIKNAFDLVLEQIKAKFEIVMPIASSIKKEFKVGDKVFIPSTISGFNITDLSTVSVIEKATENNESYLIIDKIQLNGSVKEYYLTNMFLTPSAIYFYEQDLIPYVQLKVGDKVKFPTTYKHQFNQQPSALREAIEKGQDYLYVIDIDSILFCDLSPSLDGIISSTYYINDLNLVPYEEPIQLSTPQVKLFTTEEKKEIPQEIVDRMLEYQLAQTGKKDINVFIDDVASTKEEYGFDWSVTIEGQDFWRDIIVFGEFDKFYEKYPKTKTTKFKVGDKVKIPTTNAFGIDLALSPQIEKARNDNQDYLYVRRIDFEGDYVLTAQIYGINGELFKEEDLVAYEEPTQTIAPKSNNPYDLVAKTLLLDGDKIKILILMKINPKNIKYRFQDLKSGAIGLLNVRKLTVEKWLNGESYDGGKIIDLIPPITAPTQTQSPQPTQTATPPPTKEWTPQDLIGKFLKYSASNRTFYVEKLIRNNPKNKLYVIVSLDTNKPIEYSYEMREISKWLNGEEFRGVKIVEDPNLTTAQTPTQASVTTPTVFTKPFEFQIGDAVALPTSLNGREMPQSELILLSKQIEEAVNSNPIQRFLFVRSIDYRDGKVNLSKSFISGDSDTFDFVDIKPYKEPIKSTAPIVVQTKVEGDYSTYSQFDLKEEKNEVEATLPYLDEDDEEYTELKLKLDMIDLWLD